MMASNAHHADNIAMDMAAVAAHSADDHTIDKTLYEPALDAQNGVKDVEAVTLTWTKKSLFAAFIR